MIRLWIACLCTLLCYSSVLQAQDLRRSPHEDTFFHFFPLDSAQLALCGKLGLEHDTDILLRNKPIDIGKSSILFAERLLQPGTYLRIKVINFSVEKQIVTIIPHTTLQYLSEGNTLLLFIKDTKANELRKDLHIYYRGKPVPYVEGKGGYLVDWQAGKESDHFLFIKDGTAWYMRELQAEPLQSNNYDYNGNTPAITPTAGYVILSKPKYKPGDTLRAYSYQITGGQGRPLRRKMQVSILDESRVYWHKKIKRKKPGSYQFAFPIPDTFMLDKNYQVRFNSRRSFIVQDQHFSYEDYNLEKATYDFFLDKSQYMAGDSIAYYISAKDENGFAQPFGKYNIDISLEQLNSLSRDTYSVKTNKLLYHTEGALTGEGLETHYFPTLLLPPGKCNLLVTFKLVNELNEEKVIRRTFAYDNAPSEFVFGQKADTILADYLYLRKSSPKKLHYYIMDREGDTVKRGALTTPFSIQILANYRLLQFFDDTLLVKSMNATDYMEDQIALQAMQTGDSVHISFHSPGPQTIYYTILKNGKEWETGSGRALQFHAKVGQSDRIEFSLSGNAVNTGAVAWYRHWRINPDAKKLQIKDNLPADILPGTELDVEVNVQDRTGKPRKNIDLSSYSIKNQFKQNAHEFYFTPRRSDTLYNSLDPVNYSLQNDRVYYTSATTKLTASFIDRFHLQRIPYYHFFFPTSRFYEYDMPLSSVPKGDSTAQFSIQFVRSYSISSPVWVSADDQPVYYATASRNNLSILPSGKHRIKLQVADKELDLGILNFHAGHKKIISVNLDSLQSGNKSLIVRDSLSALLLDSLTMARILAHSYITHGLSAAGLLRFPHMIYYLGSFPGQVPQVNFLGNTYQFWGPYYETRAQLENDKKTTSLQIGCGSIHYYSTGDSFLSARALPQTPWPASTVALSFQQVFDTLLYPAAAAPPYENSYIRQPNQNKPPEENAVPLFQDFVPNVGNDSFINYCVFDPYGKLNCIAVIQKDNIERCVFRRSLSSSTYTHIQWTDKADLFFQLKSGEKIVYHDVSFNELFGLYVNVDSLRHSPASASDILLYENIYTALTSTNKQLFTNFPEQVKVRFEKSQTGRRSSMIQGRLIDNPYPQENIYLEQQGRFVAGALTDEKGNFRFLDVAPGTYMVKLHPRGKRPLYIYNLVVGKGELYSLSVAIENDHKPIVLSAVNSFYELLIYELSEPGSIRFFDQKTNDPIRDAHVEVYHDSSLITTLQVSIDRASFPVYEWPTGSVVNILITAPGYKPLYIKNLETDHELQYNWKFFLQPKPANGEKSSSTFVNGEKIGNYSSFYPVQELPEKNLSKLSNSDAYKIQFVKAEDSETIKEPLTIRVYQDFRLVKTALVSWRHELQVALPGAGSYEIEIHSASFQTQRIKAELLKSGIYSISLSPFSQKAAIDAPGIGVAMAPQFDESRSEYRSQAAPPMTRGYSTRTASQIEHSAAGTDILSMVALTKNVYQSRNDGDVQIGGDRGNGTVYYVDGVLASSPVDNLLKNTITKSKSRTALTEEEAKVMKANSQAIKLRKQFSDDAYFKTGLRTNKAGKAFFHVRFPDDITQWDVWHIAMGRHYYYGEQQKQISAYKPVTVNIRTPRYMYMGDSLEMGYNFRNLMTTSKNASWQAKANEQILFEHSGVLSKGLSDSGFFFARDLNPVSFYTKISTSDSFIDQELRIMPIKAQTVAVHSDTSFAVLDTDFYVRKDAGELVKLRITQTLAEYLSAVTESLEAYPYYCTEQKCSKLMGLLYAEKIAKHIGQPFNKRASIRRMIRELTETQNSNGSFGWWKCSGDLNMTLIAYDALIAARRAGYMESSSGNASQYLLTQLQYSDPAATLNILNTLMRNGVSVGNYANKTTDMSLADFRDPFDQLEYLRLIGSYKDSLNKTAIWGAMQQLNGELAMSAAPVLFTREPRVKLLRSFRLFRGTKLEDTLRSFMQRYMDAGMHMRSSNTYEQSLLLEAFYDLSLKKEKKSKSYYTINDGKQNRHFPLQLSLSDTATHIHYKGQKAWVTTDRIRNIVNAKAKDTFFIIKTQINAKGVQQDSKSLQLNSDYDLHLYVFSFMAYDHIMITVPLPAGMTLKHKIPYAQGVEHIEYYNDRIIMYCSRMEIGQHEWDIPVRASFKGKCAWPPVRAELMYRSEVYGHNTYQSLQIR